ncbi:Glycosyltransferase [Sulfitobacter noctilucae]|uniref:glycosyltransferase n=1 Tax=Sulfitobacter noctilucae TaxID=1342302 RepID=UPI0004698452|nr:glycosyltransferase [Sulfitobacter noctilucae]KIN60371.1 Glycosyltransferase [Sulfitobacter noctilucae]
MKHLPKVLHLIDDTTAGGVMRVLDFLRSDSAMAQTADHKVKSVKRGTILGNLGPADVIVSHLAVSWRSLPALVGLRASHPRTPLVHVEHSYTEGFMTHNVPSHRRFKTLLKLAYSFFDWIVCVSNGQANWMVSNRLVHTDKLSTIQSCVDLSAFRALPAPTGPARVFGAIGRLDHQKGFDTLIKAFRQCSDPDIQLHIIGEGAEEPALKALAGNDRRIVFRGFQSDPVTAIANVDVVLMPSRWEAYGLVAVEALAAGRRLLCHDVDGLSDHAQHGGVMMETGNIKELSALIAREAKDGSQLKEGSIVRTTQQLENRFRDCWQYMLREVGV